MAGERKGWDGTEGKGRKGRERRVPEVTPSKNPRSATVEFCCAVSVLFRYRTVLFPFTARGLVAIASHFSFNFCIYSPRVKNIE